MVVPAIHPIERTVVNRLHAVLDGEIGAASQLGEQIERFVGHAVRPGANRQPDHLRVFERLLVERPEPLDRSVGVGSGLKVSQEFIDVVPPFEPANAVVELAANGRSRHAPAGAEAAIVTKYAPPLGHRSINVRTCETGVEADFLDPLLKLLP